MAAIKDTVDFAVESDDLLPLVRLVFAADDLGEDVNNTKRNMDKAIHHLQTITATKTAEVRHAYRVNASTIAAAITDLPAVQQRSTDLERSLRELHATLQQLDVSLVSAVDRKETLASALTNLEQATLAIEDVEKALQLCQQIAAHIDNKRLLPAQRLLNTLRQTHVSTLSSSSGQVDHFIGLQIADLERQLESAAITDLNSWLTDARERSRAVGERGIQRADAQRQRELKRQEMITAAAAAVFSSAAAPPQNSNNSNNIIAALEPLRKHVMNNTNNSRSTTKMDTTTSSSRNDPSSTHNNPQSENEEGDILCGLDMAPLSRAAHILTSKEGGKSLLLERYFSARALQLATDLSNDGSDDLLECYRPQLSAAVGHFLIEDRVAATVPALNSPGDLAASWEGASAAISAVVRASLDEAPAHGALLGLKEVTVWCCRALESCERSEIDTEIIREAVLSKAGRYRETLTESTAGEIRRAAGDIDALKQIASRVTADAKAFLVDLLPSDRLAVASVMEVELVLAAALEALRAEGQTMQSPTTSPSRIVRDAAVLTASIKDGDLSFFKENVSGELNAKLASSPLFAALKRAEADAGSMISSQLNSKLQEALKSMDWTPKSLPKTGGAVSAFMQPIYEALDKQRAELAAEKLPQFSINGVILSAVRSIGERVMEALASDTIPMFNVFALQLLLSDFECLARVAGEHQDVSSIEVVLFCQVIVFGRVEELLVADVRREKYKALKLERCIKLLGKVVAAPGMGTSKTKLDLVANQLQIEMHS